jgi:hypothetical protein
VTFSTAIAEQNSFRGVLVRFTGARDVTLSLTSLGSNRYSYVFEGPVVITSVLKNATALTVQTSAAAVNADMEYHYDESTYTLTVQSNTAPAIASTLIIVKYYLFFTDSSYLTEAPETPTDSASSLRYWEPRLRGGVSLAQDVTNLISGIFSLSLSSITLVNTDRALNRWLGQYDSFYQKPVDFFFVVNAKTNTYRAFQGCVTQISVQDDAVTFSLDDAFSRLKQMAYMGDTREEAVFLDEAGSFPNMNHAQSGRPCKFIIGSRTRHDQYIQSGNLSGSTNSPPRMALREYDADNAESYEEAVNTNYSAGASTSANRTWGLCRIPTGCLKSQTFGTFVRYKIRGSIDNPVLELQQTGHNLVEGEIIQMDNGGGTYLWCYVLYAGSFTDTGDAYNLSVEVVSDSSNDLPELAPPAYVAQDSVRIWVLRGEDGLMYQAMPGRDYTVTKTTTSGGNQYLSITFVNNFEANYPFSAWSGPLDPSADRVFFHLWLTGNSYGHADVVQDLCEESGLSVNAASFAAAASGLSANCRFSIPMATETEYRRYIDYCEEILKGTFGVLSLNNAGEVLYNLIDVPSSTDSRDTNSVLNDSFTASIDYEDICSTLVFKNVHFNSVKAKADGDAYQVHESVPARYLHGIERTEELEHVLEDMSARAELIFKFRSNRKVVYTFKTPTIDLETEISDDLQIEHPNVLGSDSSVDVTVIGYRRSPENVEIKATDLKGDFS